MDENLSILQHILSLMKNGYQDLGLSQDEALRLSTEDIREIIIFGAKSRLYGIEAEINGDSKIAEIYNQRAAEIEVETGFPFFKVYPSRREQH